MSASRASSSLAGRSASSSPSLVKVMYFHASFSPIRPCWTLLRGISRSLSPKLEDGQHIGRVPAIEAVHIRRRIHNHQGGGAGRGVGASIPPIADAGGLFFTIVRQNPSVRPGGNDARESFPC